MFESGTLFVTSVGSNVDSCYYHYWYYATRDERTQVNILETPLLLEALLLLIWISFPLSLSLSRYREHFPLTTRKYEATSQQCQYFSKNGLVHFSISVLAYRFLFFPDRTFKNRKISQFLTLYTFTQKGYMVNGHSIFSYTKNNFLQLL